MINLRMLTAPPNPQNRKAHNEHCRAMKHAMTEALRRELGNALKEGKS